MVVKNVGYAMRCDCCVMSDVENDSMSWDVRCGGVMHVEYGVKLCEICYDAECWCGVE